MSRKFMISSASGITGTTTSAVTSLTTTSVILAVSLIFCGATVAGVPAILPVHGTIATSGVLTVASVHTGSD